MDIKVLHEQFKFKYRVSAIYIYNKKLLVEQYGGDTYCLPGGYVEIGESSEKAMIRELKEELNLDFEIVSFAGVIENFFTNIKNQKTHEINFYYYVKLMKDEDYQLIDYKRIENDKGYIVKHNFNWLEIDKLSDFKLLPLEVRKNIQNAEVNFHMVINDN